MDFSKALQLLKDGESLRLPFWNKGVCIKCEYPTETSKMTAPYLYIESRFGCVPWKETMIELFSDYWELVK